MRDARLPDRMRDPTDEERARGVAVAYAVKNFTLYRAVVERLDPAESFRIETSKGTFEMTRGQVETTFPWITQTASYLTGPPSAPGTAYYTISGAIPAGAEPFRVSG